MKLNSIHSKQFSTSAFHCYSLFICVLHHPSIHLHWVPNDHQYLCWTIPPNLHDQQLWSIYYLCIPWSFTLTNTSMKSTPWTDACQSVATSICTENLLAFIDLTYMHIYLFSSVTAKLHLSRCMSAPHKYVLHQCMSCNLKIYPLTCITNIELLCDW